jgi:broad specificity phosphatase PhoE
LLSEDRLTNDARTRVYVVRHGRTALNAQGRFRGRQDPPLDEQGSVDAHWATRALWGAPLEAVYTSPLVRARETAEAIGEPHGLVAKELADLIDLDFGAWEGLTHDEAAENDADLFRRFHTDPETVTLPGGESVSAVADRALEAFHALAEWHPGGSVAAVTHEVVIRLALVRTEAIGRGSMWDVLLPTGSIVEFVSHAGRLSVAGAVGALLKS